MKKLAILLVTVLLLGAFLSWLNDQGGQASATVEVALAPEPEPPVEDDGADGPPPRAEAAADSERSVTSSSAPEPGVNRGTRDTFPERGCFGYVHSDDGRPVEGAQVSIEVKAPWAMATRVRRVTDRNGFWSASWDLRGLTRSAYAERTRQRRQNRAPLEEAFLARLQEQVENLDTSEIEAALAAQMHEVTTLADEEHWTQPLSLTVTARAGKFERGSRTLPLSSRLSGALRVDLVLEPQFEFSGEVIFEGRALPGADVLLFDHEWSFLDATRSDFAGEFVFATPEPGRFQVHARRENVGAGGVGGVHLGGPFETPRIVVPVESGRGLLRGKLVFPDGEPIVGVEVVAVESGLSLLNSEAPARPGLGALAQAEAPGGLALGRGRTRADGEFLMAGMQAGSFLLRVEGFDDVHQPTETITPGVDNRVEIDAHLVRVIVTSNRGEVPLGTRVHLQESLAPGAARGRTPRSLTLPALRGPRADKLNERRGKRRRGNSSPKRNSLEATFLVEPESSWRAWATQGGESTPSELARVNESPQVVTVELILPNRFGSSDEADAVEPGRWTRYQRPPEPAQLRVDLMGADETLLPCRLSLWRVGDEGELTRALTNTALRPGQSTPALPPGEYLWSLRAAGDERDLEPPLVNRKLTLRPGENARLQLEQGDLEAPVEATQAGKDDDS